MATALPRITARVDAEIQELLAQAAAIAGMTSINSFVLNARITSYNVCYTKLLRTLVFLHQHGL